MARTISKSKLKPHILQYLREVEETGEAIIITDHGLPVLKVVPYSQGPASSIDALAALRSSVVKYEAETEPVGVEDWESLR